MNSNEARPVAPVSTPLEIEVIDGEVVIIGPGSVAFSMTAEAAAATCERLQKALASLG